MAYVPDYDDEEFGTEESEDTVVTSYQCTVDEASCRRYPSRSHRVPARLY